MQRLNPRMGPSEWALLLLLSLLWGASYLFAQVAVTALPPITVAWIRVALAGLVLWGVVLASRLPLPATAAGWGGFLLVGLLNNAIPFSLIYFGQTRIPSGLAAIMNATMPLFAAVIAHLFRAGERLTVLRVAGVVAGIAGVALMLGPDIAGHGGFDLLGQAACLAAAVFYAFGSLVARRMGGLSPIVNGAGQLGGSTLLLLAPMLIVDRPWLLPVPPLAVMLALLALAVLSTALASSIYFQLVKRAGMTNTSLVTFLMPVWAILLGWMLLGERLAPRHGLGLALIALGLAAIDGRAFDRLRHRA